MTRAVLVTLIMIVYSVGLSQTKLLKGLIPTFDCAMVSNVIKKTDLKNCTKIVLMGDGAESYTIVSFLISINASNILTEYVNRTEILSKMVIDQMNNLKSGDKVFIENVRIKQESGDDIYTLPSNKVTVK